MKDKNHSMKKELEPIEAFLRKHGFICMLASNKNTPSPPFLLINLGEDVQRRSYVLQINFIPLPKQEAHSVPYPFDLNPYMQFVAILPFQVDKNHESIILKMLAQLNNMLEIPGFGYNEILNQLYFRYTYYSYENYLHQGWLLSIVAYVRTILDLFAEWIEDISLGKTSLEEVAAKYKNIDLKKFTDSLKKMD